MKASQGTQFHFQFLPHTKHWNIELFLFFSGQCPIDVTFPASSHLASSVWPYQIEQSICPESTSSLDVVSCRYLVIRLITDHASLHVGYWPALRLKDHALFSSLWFNPLSIPKGFCQGLSNFPNGFHLFDNPPTSASFAIENSPAAHGAGHCQ